MKKEKLTKSNERGKFKSSPKKMSEISQSRSRTSRAFALGVAALLTVSNAVDAFAENCKNLSRAEIAKVMKATPYEGRLRKAFECLGQPEIKQIRDYKCLDFKKDGKPFFEDCEDNEELSQVIDKYTPNVTVERRPKTPPPTHASTHQTKFTPTSRSANGESDAARETRLLREQLAREEEARIRRERDQKIDAAMDKRYGWH